MAAPTKNTIRFLKVTVFFLCLWPLASLVIRVIRQDLGANPVETLLHANGLWALKFLLMTLAVTPIRRLSGQVWLIRFRRMLGLFAFFYAVLHFAIYVSLDLAFDFPNLGEDILERPYITIGFTALLLLIPLAVTSTNAMMRRLGPRWVKLHWLIYPIAMLGVWHFWWQVKKDIQEPLIYTSILLALLGYRVARRWRANSK